MRVWKKQALHLAAFLPLVFVVTWHTACAAGPLRGRILERQTARKTVKEEMLAEEDASTTPATLPATIQIIRDVAYGNDVRQRFDVYSSKEARNAPVIFMVHGGGWRIGKKSTRSVVEHKVTRWVPMGFVVISTDYRMLPDGVDPIEQARDVARAIAVAQQKAAFWGGDADKFILMGHSAGAHLVALLATDRSLSADVVSWPWLGVVALDSAAYNVVEIMKNRHLPLYDKAFGNDPQYWRAASPFYAVTQTTKPILAVYSTRRANSSAQARAFARKANELGASVSVLRKDFSHGEINSRLGKDPTYTTEVESFIARLDWSVAGLLSK